MNPSNKTQPMSLKDFFKSLGKTLSTPPAEGYGISGFSSRKQTLPNDAGSYMTPVPAPYGSIDYVSPIGIRSLYGDNGAGADYAYPQTPKAPTPTPTPTPTPKSSTPSTGGKVFTGGTPTPDQAPVLDYSRYINPATGKVFTPEEYANKIASRIGSGSIPTYAGDAIENPNLTAEQLMKRARTLNNERNDIAVGETDPYGVGSKSGIQYTPAELSAIEKAYAGVYDPVINDVFAKLEERKKKDQEEADIKAEDRKFQNDLKKMEQQFEYDKKLKQIVTPGSGSGNSNQKIDNERAAQTLFQNNPIVKDYNTVIAQKNAIDAIIANGTGGPADVSAIFTFMKALDPNSVVRESEFDKAAKSGNLFQGYWSKFNGYFKDKGGFLPANVQDEFKNLINQKLNAQKAAYDNVANQTREIVSRQGLDPNNVVIDFTGGILNLQPNVVTAPDGTKVEIVD